MQPFMVSHGPKTFWKLSDVMYKWFDGRSKALHKDLAKAFSSGPPIRTRDSGARIGEGSSFISDEVKWRKATTSSYEIVAFLVRSDKGSYFGSQRDESLMIRVLVSFHFKIGDLGSLEGAMLKALHIFLVTVKFKRLASMESVGGVRIEGGDGFGAEAVMLWITDAAYFETMVSSNVVNHISKLLSLGGKETKVRALLSFPIEFSTLCFSLQASYLGLKTMHVWPSEL
ncbi:hypothetical protein V6N13_149097 [Hibiscus sabdariffa]